MNTVKDALAQKSGALIHVRSGEHAPLEALRQHRATTGSGRRRSSTTTYWSASRTQGDCARSVRLPGLDAKQISGGPSDDGRTR